MNAIPPPPPLEYDSSTRSLRSVEWYSAPMNLLWVLAIALIVFGFASHGVWIAAGVVVAAVVVIEVAMHKRSNGDERRLG